MKRVALLIGAVLLLAACGGGGSSTGSGDQAQITNVFTSFFSSKESVASKPALVENGAKFKSAIEKIATNPFASHTSARVSKVTLNGPSKATVVYSIYLGSNLAIKSTTAHALKENGKWVIADSSLCQLLAKEGGSTPACQPTY
jgi:hypothetical protein